MIHSVIQTPSGGKFYNTLSLTGGMCVGVGNLSGGTEIILQILPRCTRRQIFHDQSVVSSGSRWVATGTASISSSESASAAATTTTAAAAAARTALVLVVHVRCLLPLHTVVVRLVRLL